MGQPKWNLISDGDIRPVNEISDMKLLCHLGSESAIIQKLLSHNIHRDCC